MNGQGSLEFGLPPASPRSFDGEESRALRDVALERVERASRAWQEKAIAAIRNVARRRKTFLVDDVWLEDLEQPREGRAMGAAIRRALSEGIIERTEEFRPSARRTSHSTPRRVWRSLIFEEKEADR